ncbi:polysaccharide deacetylase family protein [Actinoplanes solisilvae]|uniref:polysaccharide deacetylase family protein n=1 Tax=Actinoplanes solisilvae TaxID=2486853 RepID=UPI00196B5774|nr:polysaccharide deacetylase family protein [Actinoplanes solisilvae]
MTSTRSATPQRRGRLLTAGAGRPPVLMYHAVGQAEDDPFNLYVTPERFAAQLNTLARLGLRGVSMADLGDAAERGKADGLVGLTFDDGYRDVLTYALPELRRHGFGATFYAVSGLLGGINAWDPPPRRPLMTADDLRALAAQGYEIGSHSVNHPRLAGIDADTLRYEVTASRAALGELLPEPPRTFCYPYGSVDAAAVRAVVDAGYSYACAVVRVPGLPTTFARPRVGVTELDHGPRLAAKLLLRGR